METYLLGAYTRRINHAIHQLDFQETDASFTQLSPLAELKNPTWITLNQAQTHLFVLDGDQLAGLTLFKRQENFSWKKVNSVFKTKSSGCHISFHEQSQTAYVSNYHEGSIDLYQIEDNQLIYRTRYFHHGSSIHPNQEASHIHMTLLSRDQSQLYACDLGADQVYHYQILENGELTLRDNLELPEGTGPRHLVLHPHLNRIYLIGELSNTTWELRIKDDHRLERLSYHLNIDPNLIHTSSGAAIKISNNGRHLYCSTRFADQITFFEVNDQGRLFKKQVIESGGKTPRDFSLNMSEDYLLVAHQDDDQLVLLKRDKENGYLSPTHHSITVPECVNVVPLK